MMFAARIRNRVWLRVRAWRGSARAFRRSVAWRFHPHTPAGNRDCAASGVLSLAFSTMFNSTTFSSNRRLQRANPSGAGEQVKAINFASAAPSKIRGRAEFGLCLRFSARSSPSSTRRRRRRPILLSWCPASRRSSCRSNLRPHPTRPPSAGYAPSAATAPGACPQKSQRLEPLRSSELNLTTYFLDRKLFPRHESPPSLCRGGRDSEKRHRINDASTSMVASGSATYRSPIPPVPRLCQIAPAGASSLS